MEICSDQGRNFEAAIMKDVCSILGIRKTRTTAFRPQLDGFVERFNKTLVNMMAMYVSDEQTDWDQIVPMVERHPRKQPDNLRTC